LPSGGGEAIFLTIGEKMTDTDTDTDIDTELEAFEAQLEELLAEHEGKFALVKNGNVIGTFDGEGDAYTEGVKLFGDDVFLVRQILSTKTLESLPALFSGVVNAGI
jgi:hypothetical protein